MRLQPQTVKIWNSPHKCAPHGSARLDWQVKVQCSQRGHLFICYQTREHNILKTNELILMLNSMSSKGNGMWQSTLRVMRSNVIRGQR